MTDLLQEIPPVTRPEADLRPVAAVVARVAQKMLQESPYSALKGVVCDEFGGVIRLGGRVPSHYLKQVAFAIVDEVVGSHPILNEIKVVAGTYDPQVAGGDAAGSGWFRMGRRV